MSRHNSESHHFPKVSISHQKEGSSLRILKNETGIKNTDQKEAILPTIKKDIAIDLLNTGLDHWNWFEHHPIEKNEKVADIGHFKHTNTTKDDKNISFIEDLFEYNREVDPNQQITIKNIEDNYKLNFKPKRQLELVKTKKHEVEYPLTLTYRFLYLIQAGKWNEASRVCRKIITLQPTQRIYREYLVLLNSFMVMKQKFINMANTRLYETRMKRNARTTAKSKGKNKTPGPPPETTRHTEPEIRKDSKLTAIGVPRISSSTVNLINELERTNSQEHIDLTNQIEHKSDLDIIIDEFYALK